MELPELLIPPCWSVTARISSIKKAPYYGTVYAVFGTYGQLAGIPQTDAPMPYMFFSDFATNCSMVIDVEGNNLNAKYLSVDRIVMDEFTISKAGPDVPLNKDKAACDINFQPGSDEIYLSMYLTEKDFFSASLLNLLGLKNNFRL